MKNVLSTIANALIVMLAIITGAVVIVITFPVFAYGFYMGYIPEFKLKFMLAIHQTTKAIYEIKHKKDLEESFVAFYQQVDPSDFQKFREEIRKEFLSK